MMLKLILVVVILLLIFGGSKLREAGSDLGSAVKGARKALRHKVPDPGPEPAAAAAAARGAFAPSGITGATGATGGAFAPGVQPDAEFPEVLAARRENRRG
jgi:TatA/E family protein of Tat protein translocase